MAALVVVHAVVRPKSIERPLLFSCSALISHERYGRSARSFRRGTCETRLSSPEHSANQRESRASQRVTLQHATCDRESVQLMAQRTLQMSVLRPYQRANRYVLYASGARAGAYSIHGHRCRPFSAASRAVNGADAGLRSRVRILYVCEGYLRILL